MTLEEPSSEKARHGVLVDWEDNDPENPRNWKRSYKIWLTSQLTMYTAIASLGSSIVSPAGAAISADMGLSYQVTVLNISLYILGFAFGPLLWGPTSEIWGRRFTLLPAMFGLALLSIGSATSRNGPSMFITRFLAGVFGSCPICMVGAVLGDIWHPKQRGAAIAFYSMANFGGAMLGPCKFLVSRLPRCGADCSTVIGASIMVNSRLGWRWTEYTQAIVSFAIFGVGFFDLPELYAPVLLVRKARRLRMATGNENFYHPHENLKLDLKSVVNTHLARPLRMLFTEPAVGVISLYASFVYALLYLTLEIFPVVFEQDRGYGLVVSTLPFIGSFVGLSCAALLNLANQPRYIHIVDDHGGKPVPEARLMPMVPGGLLLVAGLFWFGWTASPRYHWASPVVAAGCIGGGSNIITQQTNNFLVDTYGLYAASAVSANIVLRSILAASLPPVARPMVSTLGVGPAMSVLGGIACLALPVPFFLTRYGKKLRSKSNFQTP